MLDLLFPPSCAGCNRLGAWLCPTCAASLTRQFRQIHDLPVHSAGAYAGWLRTELLRFKSGNRESRFRLGQVLCLLVPLVGKDSVLVPIPSSPGKIRERGFDTIGELVAGIKGHGLAPKLLSVRAGVVDQVGLGRMARAANLADAFICRGRVSRPLWIVDDVVTTGSTIGAAAKALRQSGNSVLGAITLCAAGNAD